MLDMYLYAAITKHDSRIAPGLLVSGVTTSHLETMTAVVGLKTLSARHTDRLLKSAYANSVNISEDLIKKYRLEGLCPHILNNFIQPFLPVMKIIARDKRVPLLGYDGTYQTRGRSSRNGLFKILLIDDYFLAELRKAFPNDALRNYPIFAQVALEKPV
jgi:hypothetical protein